MSYDEKFVAGLEWLWGEGFLSPGGPEYVADILQGTDLMNRSVLDFGCGIGGIDRLLITEYGASKVVGVDVIESLLDRARSDAERCGLSARIEYQLIEPGPLVFEDAQFDAVFSKDSIIHLPAKPMIYAEFFRVLRPGGMLAGSDWLGSAETGDSERVKAWLDFSQLDFHFCTADELQGYLHTIGFESIHLRDRNAWYRKAVREEIDQVSGANREAFERKFGKLQTDARVQSSTLKMKVVDAGEMRPTLFRAVKP